MLDDGRRVRASGDAAILRLAEPLPFGVSAAPIGDGGGDSFTIAGYGTADESAGGGFGALRQANLVAASRGALVDPFRQATSAPAPASAIPAGRSCAAACWSASSPAPRYPYRASPAEI